MYTSLLNDARFHRMLQELDEKTAAEVKTQGCTKPGCDGKLHLLAGTQIRVILGLRGGLCASEVASPGVRAAAGIAEA